MSPSFKCKLEPHYHIPTPVLSILVGKLPKSTTTTTVSPFTTKQITTSKSSLKQSNRVDSWDKEWSWGIDDDKASSTSPQLQPSSEQQQPALKPPSLHASSSPLPIQSDLKGSTSAIPTRAANTASSPSSSSPSSSSSTTSTTSTCSFSPPVLAAPIGKEAYLVSASAAGKYIAMAYQRKFVVVALHPDQGEYIVIGQGSGCSENDSDERITSVLCLPLFVPSTRKNQLFIMIGYSTGWLRVYSSTGTLLTAQLLETSPIISIKLRTPPPPPPTRSSLPSSSPPPPPTIKHQKSKQQQQQQPIYANSLSGSTRHSHHNHQYYHQDDEEITLLFGNNRVVSIDGQSLWMVLRVCDGQRESGIDASKMQTAFTYKKWQLDRQEKVRDILSLGPSVAPSSSSSSDPSMLLGGGSGRSLRMGSSWWWWSTATAAAMGATGAGSSNGSSGDPTTAMTAAALYSLMLPSSSSSSSSSSVSSSSSISSTSVLPTATTSQSPVPLFAEATSRYIGVGTHPMISFYATHETSRPYMSAVSMASYMVSRVASPVFSFAKSWWAGTATSSNSSSNHNDDILSSSPGSTTSTSPLSSSPSQNTKTPFVPDMPTPPQVIEPASTIPSLLHLSDPGRSIQSIVVAPPFQHSQHHTLAATSDALGRVILWDIQQGQMIRMWKGVRDAHCGWIQYRDEENTNPKLQRPRLLLFLVIYSARRGLLKVYQTRHGAYGHNQQQKPVGVFHVGPGWHLVACAHEPLGSSMVSSGRKKAAMLQGGEECGVLSTCLLISPHGEVRKITILPSLA